MSQSAFKPVWLVFAGVCAVLLFVGLERILQAKEIVPWRADLSASKAEASNGNKPLLLYFTASWCGPCQSMKHTTWADAAVETALRNYVPVKIDVDEQPIIAGSFNVEAMPTFVVLTPAGKEMRRDVGAMDSQTFLGWLAQSGKEMPSTDPAS